MRSPASASNGLWSRMISAGVTLLVAFVGTTAVSARAEFLTEEALGVPLRVRDYTFPSFLVLGFAPAPAATLGRRQWGLEVHYSRVNDFQVSSNIEAYLEGRFDGVRRRLGPEDVDYVSSLPRGQGFYVDGEVGFLELAWHRGLTDRLDAAIGMTIIDYGGSGLDRSIFDFHDRFGLGQQGRSFVADHDFQIVLGVEGERLVFLDGPPAGGVSDPWVALRYRLPSSKKRWKFSLGAAVKMPLADVEGFLSTGGWDLGLQWVADWRGRRNAWIVNVSLVEPGDYEIFDFNAEALSTVHLAWIHGFRRFPNARFLVQTIAAEHIFGEIVDSDFTRPQFQVTLGWKWQTASGVIGLGLTENVLNMDNTPDIGLHFTWGVLTGPRVPAQ